MEIVVGRDYVYGRFNTAVTVVTVLEGYTPVEIRLQNNRTCWVHRAELRENMPEFDFDSGEEVKYEPHAEPFNFPDESKFTWHGMPNGFTLQEDVEWYDDGGQKHGVREGTILYIRGTHDVLDVFLLATDTDPGAVFFTASGQWVNQQRYAAIEKARKIREAEIVDARLAEVLENEKKETKENRKAIWANKVDRFFDWCFNVAPFFFFFVSLFFVWFDDGTLYAVWAMIAAVFFAVTKVVDVLYLLHYKMGRMSDADSE